MRKLKDNKNVLNAIKYWDMDDKDVEIHIPSEFAGKFSACLSGRVKNDMLVLNSRPILALDLCDNGDLFSLIEQKNASGFYSNLPVLKKLFT